MAILSEVRAAHSGSRLDGIAPEPGRSNVALTPIFGTLNCAKRNMTISPDDLSAFTHLADSLHFARSAKALHMSPSALTRCIQRIEADLGQTVFQRTKRSVTLTRAGELFRDYARAQLAAHAHLKEALAAETEAPTGELRIACTVTACHSILPKLLARF